MHLHRETVLASAQAKVISQIKPCSVRPTKSVAQQLLKNIQPIIEITLNLCGPNAEEKFETQTWIVNKIKTGDYNYLARVTWTVTRTPR